MIPAKKLPPNYYRQPRFRPWWVLKTVMAIVALPALYLVLARVLHL